MNKDQWDPEFLKAIPIMKTRSGMQVRAVGSIFCEAALFFYPQNRRTHYFAVCLQFSCASPSHSCLDSGCEVWVCNSDGYVGQVRRDWMRLCHVLQSKRKKQTQQKTT